MPDIHIRRAERRDIPALIRLRWDTCVEQGVADQADQARHARYAAALHAFLARWIDDAQCWVFVAVDAGTGQVVATAALWRWPILPWPGGLAEWQGYVTGAYTVPAYRRRGIARSLMATVRETAAALGVTRLLLETTPMSAPLYQELGFVPSRFVELRLPG
ncbi:MAG: GNAT family N-acetyltransferase [Sphaerobacter sp.]|nr:GNAT family N-acetyltransferase [Sphaerobacter sp.]